MAELPRLPKVFLNSLNAFKKKNPEDWEEKYRIATERILSSVLFYVAAKECCRRDNNLLSAVGYYYSLFHMSKALLFLLPHHTISELKGISHRKVLNLVRTELVQRKILNSDYVRMFDYFKEVRAAANYKMGSWSRLSEDLKNEEPKLLLCIEEAISVFKEICRDEVSSIRAIIGDGIGDDWMDSYLSKNEAKEAVNFFLAHDLTT